MQPHQLPHGPGAIAQALLVPADINPDLVTPGEIDRPDTLTVGEDDVPPSVRLRAIELDVVFDRWHDAVAERHRVDVTLAQKLVEKRDGVEIVIDVHQLHCHFRASSISRMRLAFISNAFHVHEKASSGVSTSLSLRCHSIIVAPSVAAISPAW